MQTDYKGRRIEADESDVVLPSTWGGDEDRQRGVIKVDGQDVTARVAEDGGDLSAQLERVKALIDAGEL